MFVGDEMELSKKERENQSSLLIVCSRFKEK
jgi:hypothetical protein